MISIIIPTFNEEKILPATLEHLSSFEDCEVIVADGDSSDGTASIAKKFAILASSSPGRGKQLNKGASLARGEILLFLHADTFLPAKALTAIKEYLKSPKVIGGRFLIQIDSNRIIYRIIETGINMRDWITKGFTGDQAMFIKRHAFEMLGGFKEFPFMEDLDMAQRMRKLGKIVRIPLAVRTSVRRWENNGVLKTILLMWIIRVLYLLGVSPYTLKRLYNDTR